jgi:nucleotide-binding universal stress UspA family protein
MLPRFQHLLAPVDFTDKNWAALDLTFELAVQNKASVTLLHVIEPIAVEDDAEVAAFMANLERRSLDDLAAMAQRFLDAGVVTEWKTRLGKRAVEIVRFASERGVDLIVMNSHRIDPEHTSAAVIGTLSHQVSVFCQCPVLLVK